RDRYGVVEAGGGEHGDCGPGHRPGGGAGSHATDVVGGGMCRGGSSIERLRKGNICLRSANRPRGDRLNGAASWCTAPSGRLRGRHPPSGYLFARTVESRLTAAIIDSTTVTPHERARSAQPNKLFAPLRSLCVTPVRLRTPQFRHPVRHPTSAAPGDHKSRPYPGACLPSVSHALFPLARSLSPPTINPIFPAAAR